MLPVYEGRVFGGEEYFFTWATEGAIPITQIPHARIDVGRLLDLVKAHTGNARLPKGLDILTNTRYDKKQNVTLWQVVTIGGVRQPLIAEILREGTRIVEGWRPAGATQFVSTYEAPIRESAESIFVNGEAVSVPVAFLVGVLSSGAVIGDSSNGIADSIWSGLGLDTVAKYGRYAVFGAAGYVGWKLWKGLIR